MRKIVCGPGDILEIPVIDRDEKGELRGMFSLELGYDDLLRELSYKRVRDDREDHMHQQLCHIHDLVQEFERDNGITTKKSKRSYVINETNRAIKRCGWAISVLRRGQYPNGESVDRYRGVYNLINDIQEQMTIILKPGIDLKTINMQALEGLHNKFIAFHFWLSEARKVKVHDQDYLQTFATRDLRDFFEDSISKIEDLIRRKFKV